MNRKRHISMKETIYLSILCILLSLVGCSHHRNSEIAQEEAVEEGIEQEMTEDDEELEGLRCSSYYSDDFFSTVPVNEIEELSMQNVLYKTDYIAYDYKGLGTYDDPQIVNDMTYDSKLFCSIIVSGYVDVSDVDQETNTQFVDSVTISHLIVLRKNHKAERFSKNDYSDKSWKDCPVPYSVRDRIRKDFLVRMKYRIYHIKTDLRNLPVYYGYSISEQDLEEQSAGTDHSPE